MAEIVNLRGARKRKARADREALAAENRVRHGRSRGEAAAIERSRKLELAHLDGHRREKPDKRD